MKRYLTLIFLAIGALVLIFGLRIDSQWTGAASWGLTLICLIFAAYYTKYIPDEKRTKKRK
ncbi:hypothetical protein [Ornithinibacillus xuwenensis]|uniref:Uncharacterized protein n=1 Tax=Ornithinibacillus xuwenensis TaxID=3144668 RepID=A0ABU9XLU3_9BACI